MEKEIGSIPDRAGFEVHVDGEEITITQFNGDFDCDLIVIHGSDAGLLMELLQEAAIETANNHNDAATAEAQQVNETCSTLPGAHCPDGTCCPPPGIPCADPCCATDKR